MLQSLSHLKGFYSWLFFNFSAPKLHPAVFMPVDEETELDKVVELPSVETIGYTHDWIHPWQSEWLHYSMCNMMGESLAKKNYREYFILQTYSAISQNPW